MKVLMPSLGTANWLGGVYYTQNIIRAARLANPQVKFVHWGWVDESLYGKSLFDQSIARIDGPRFSKEWFKKYALAWAPNAWALGNLTLKVTLNAYDVNFCVSNPAIIDRKPFICWLGDFQHRKNPEYFSASDVRDRDQHYQELVKKSAVVIVSSQTAENDCYQYHPQARGKTQVLRFTPLLDGVATASDVANTLAKFQIETPYFYLPNQFWKHKNHGVVIEALALAKAQGQRLLVVSTGLTADRRWPQYYSELKEKITKLGVEAEFKTLGVVERSEVMALMKGAHAVINPSFFEGWSSTVEEAKALGKKIILSDLPVHREQAPIDGEYFAPTDALALATLLMRTRTAPQKSAPSDAELLDLNRQQCLAFGQAYLNILQQSLNSKAKLK